MTVYADGPELEKISHEAMEWVHNFKMPTSKWANIVVLAAHPDGCDCEECYEAEKDTLREVDILPKKILSPDDIDRIGEGYNRPEN